MLMMHILDENDKNELVEKIKTVSDETNLIKQSTEKILDTKIEFISGKNIKLAYDIGSVIDLTPENVISYRYSIIDCEYGDTFLINVQGGVNPRAWGFVDKNNVLLSVAAPYVALENLILQAPENSAKLIINDNNTNKDCLRLGKITQNEQSLISAEQDFSYTNKENNKNFLYQIDNFISAFGYDFNENALGKIFTVTGETGYNAWPFLGTIKNILVCLFSKGTQHTDNSSNVFYKTSNNGLIWTGESKLVDNYGNRTNVTGKGNDSDGNLLFWVRSGSPGDSSTFSLYKTSDGNTFEKISSPIFSIKAGHIGDIAFIENMGLIAFYNTYKGSINSYGYVLSTDNGVTWKQYEIERTETFDKCPTEISFVYLGDGKILAMGRSEKSEPMYQIETNDYGKKWTCTVTNISNVLLSTPSLILDNDSVSVYYYNRNDGKLNVRKSKITDIFGNPTNWSQPTVLVNGETGEDSGNVNAVKFNNHHIISYYSGNNTTTKIYIVIN